MFVLDTDHISLLERSGSSESYCLRHRLNEVDSENVATTIITFEEQMRGWLAYLAKSRSISQQVEAYSRLNRHIENYRTISVLTFDEKAADIFQQLQKSRIRIGTMDLRIAAITLANDATLLSRNLSDFSRVPELKIEDWTVYLV